MIVIIAMNPSSLILFWKDILISLMKGKKVGNANNVRRISKQKARWNNTLKPFMLERVIIFVSYAAKHLCGNPTWTLICGGFMRGQSGINVKAVKKVTKQSKFWKNTLKRCMKETSRLSSVNYVIKILRARTLWNVTLKLFMKRKSHGAVLFVRPDLDKSQICRHIWKLYTAQCNFKSYLTYYILILKVNYFSIRSINLTINFVKINTQYPNVWNITYLN